jgi:hypothetical protein
MTTHLCPHETEVLDLVAIDQWPQRADAALRAHVAACASCADLASIATAVREWGHVDAVPRMPEATVVWHRAQVRARAEAAHAAFRPLWLAQGFAAVALVVALVWIGPSASWYASIWQSASSSMPSVGRPNITALPAGWGWSVGLAIAGVVLFVSLVVAALKISERSEHSEISK